MGVQSSLVPLLVHGTRPTGLSCSTQAAMQDLVSLLRYVSDCMQSLQSWPRLYGHAGGASSAGGLYLRLARSILEETHQVHGWCHDGAPEV